jgi:hypothetical protein
MDETTPTPTSDILTKAIAFCLFCTGVFFPLFIGPKNIFFYTSCGLALLDKDVRKNLKIAFRFSWTWVSIVLAILFIINTFHSIASTHRAINICGKYMRLFLPILLIPLFLKKIYARGFFNGLAVGISALCITWLAAKFNFFIGGGEDALRPYIINPIYASYICASAAFVGIYAYWVKERLAYLTIFVFGLIFSCICSYQFTGFGIVMLWMGIVCLDKKIFSISRWLNLFFLCVFIATVCFNFPVLLRAHQKLNTLTKITLHLASRQKTKVEMGVDNNDKMEVPQEKKDDAIEDWRWSFMQQGAGDALSSKTKFFTGNGTGSWADMVAAQEGAYLDQPISEKNVPNPHNEYLHVFVQLGFIGLCVFLLFLAAPIVDVFRMKYREQAIVIGIVGAFAFGCFADTMLFLTVTRDFYLCLLSWALAKTSKLAP